MEKWKKVDNGVSNWIKNLIGTAIVGAGILTSINYYSDMRKGLYWSWKGFNDYLVSLQNIKQNVPKKLEAVCKGVDNCLFIAGEKAKNGCGFEPYLESARAELVVLFPNRRPNLDELARTYILAT